MSGLVAFERWIDTAPIGLQDVEKKVVALKDKIMKQAHPESFTGLRAVQSEDVQ